MTEPTPSHLIGRAVTGHARGAFTGEPVVTLDLWAVDVSRPGCFSLYPDAARALAYALLDSADRAEADQTE